MYRQTSNMRPTSVGNTSLITEMKLEHRLSALLQLHLHSQLNTWFQWIGQRQLQDETRMIWGLEFGATYIRDFTVSYLFSRQFYVTCFAFPLFMISPFIFRIYCNISHLIFTVKRTWWKYHILVPTRSTAGESILHEITPIYCISREIRTRFGFFSSCGYIVLYGPRCPLSPKRPINLINLSLVTS